MKRLIVAAIILALIIGACVFTSVQLNLRTEGILNGVEKSQKLFEQKDFSGCAKHLEKIEKEWISDESILMQLVGRERLEEIGRSIALLRSYAQTEDDAGFYSSLEDIKIQIAHLKKEEDFGI